MGVTIQFSQSYYWLNSWIMANVIQLATQDFCERFLDYRIDPCRRLYEQMTMAARSGVANIAEGSARHSTSIESEMRLLDVSRGSFDELQSDIFNFLLRRRADVWAIGNPDREAIWQMRLDPPNYSNSYLHDAAIHILVQKSKFDRWLENENPEIAANALLVLCVRENRMLEAQMQSQLEGFKQTGGFSENMTAERLQARKDQAAKAANSGAAPTTRNAPVSAGLIRHNPVKSGDQRPSATGNRRLIACSTKGLGVNCNKNQEIIELFV